MSPAFSGVSLVCCSISFLFFFSDEAFLASSRRCRQDLAGSGSFRTSRRNACST